MVTYMGPYVMSRETRTRVIRLAAAKGIFPDAMVTQLIDAGLQALDPGESVSGGDVDLTYGITRRIASLP